MGRPPDERGRELIGRTGPVASSDRIISLDVLRGFAVLGILVMNIQSFAMPSAAYTNPTAYGDLTGANLFTWAASHLLVDEKFMTLFSLLFGAGVCLFAERAEARGGRSGGLHYRRMFWLLLIGLAHGYLLWSGDFLVTYAVCGCLVFLLRDRAPAALFVTGLVVMSVASFLSFSVGLIAPALPERETADIAAAWAPAAAEIEASLRAYRGGWLAQQEQRVPDTLMMQTTVLPFLTLWKLRASCSWAWRCTAGESSTPLAATPSTAGWRCWDSESGRPWSRRESGGISTADGAGSAPSFSASSSTIGEAWRWPWATSVS